MRSLLNVTDAKKPPKADCNLNAVSRWETGVRCNPCNGLLMKYQRLYQGINIDNEEPHQKEQCTNGVFNTQQLQINALYTII